MRTSAASMDLFECKIPDGFGGIPIKQAYLALVIQHCNGRQCPGARFGLYGRAQTILQLGVNDEK